MLMGYNLFGINKLEYSSTMKPLVANMFSKQLQNIVSKNRLTFYFCSL